PIHYQVEPTFSVPIKVMSAELGTHHYQVDTLKSQNLAALYVSCDRVLIGSVTTSLLKRALEQCKRSVVAGTDCTPCTP
ncbi:hypothetical protein AB4376_18795, partial [Vibrio breoganii]